MSTVFIAVQCFQCSTMQVKQQKKSGNKWTCVVCNQKQSVRKVYAQGFMARDVRTFVQSFNMSRKFADEQSPNQTLVPQSQEPIDDQFPDNQKKRRTDWTVYLDPEDYGQDQAEEGGDYEPEIVTELPKEVFKKPKLKNYSTGSSTKEGGDGLFRPVFSKRDTTKHVVVPQDKEPRKCQPTMTKGPSQWRDYITQDNKEPKQCQPTLAMGASKWNDYITQGDDNELELGRGRDFEDQMGRWSHGEVETLLNEQRVEEDIHPDFM